MYHNVFGPPTLIIRANIEYERGSGEAIKAAPPYRYTPSYAHPMTISQVKMVASCFVPPTCFRPRLVTLGWLDEASSLNVIPDA